MDMMSSMAIQSMDLSAAKLRVSYSMSMSKEVMDLQENMATQLVQEMLPPLNPTLGTFIDTYA